MKPFSERLKEFRADAELTLAQMSKKVKVPVASLSQYERGDHEPLNGKVLRALRRAKDLRQVDVAKAADVDVAVVSRIENNRVRDTLAVTEAKMRILKALGVKDEPLDAVPDSEPVGGTNAGGNASPAKRGQVSRAWVEQMADSHVHARAYCMEDGPYRTIMIRRPDLIDLVKAALQACGTRVEG